jgi:YD repeat-containing protein
VKNILLLLCFLHSFLNSQILDNKHGQAFTDEPFFNEKFIHLNKVKKIKGEYTFKKAGDIMRKTEFKSIYQFNSLGQLISTFETRSENGIKDTIENTYEYSEKNQLILHRKNDSGGYGSVHYERDSLNRIVVEETHRDIVNKKGELERTFIINHETMKYDSYSLQDKKTVYNSYDLPYLEEICYYNEDGYLLEKEDRLKMTSGRVKYVYEYNNKGLISAIRSVANVDGTFAEEWLFKYDEWGNLSEKHVYKNGVYTTDIQIIYNVDTKLLSSVLTRDVNTNFIMILRFLDYEFYE